MLNESCIREIMLYLDENLKQKKNGKYYKIQVRSLLNNYSFSNFSEKEVYSSITVLLEKKLITKTNPQNHTSPRATCINGITTAGYYYIASVAERNLWEKHKDKLTIDNIFSAINTGISITSFLGSLL